jgi:hypothetical protein
MKKHNPETPILIREATGVAPKVWARYSTFGRFQAVVVTEANDHAAMGRERSEDLAGKATLLLEYIGVG